MPRTEIISSDEEDSVWEYRSQSKKIKLTPDPRFTSIKSERENLTQTANPRKRTRKIARKDGHSQLKSLPVLNGSNRLMKFEKEDSQDDFKPDISMTQPSLVKMEPINRKSISVKDDPDKSQTRNSKNSKRHTVQKKKSKQQEQTTPNEKIRSGRCRVCQFPFSALSRVDTPSWHEEVCLEVPYSSKEQCPSGVNCSSTILSHYKKFRHTALSRSQHKYDQTRPVATSGDIQSAKVKLEFDENPGSHSTILKVPSSALDCIIDLDDSSEETETVNKSYAEGKESKEGLSQTEKSTKARYNQLKRNSLKTLMKKNMNKIVKKVRSTEVQGKITGKQSSTITSTIPSSKGEIITNCSETDILFSSKSCGNSVIINQSMHQMLTLKSENCDDEMLNLTNTFQMEDNLFEKKNVSEKVLTKVNAIDLLETESSNSVQDIDNVTDNSRSITEMLRDVFDENDTEDSGKKLTETIKESGMLFEDGSSNDTDILQTGIPFSQVSKTCLMSEASPNHSYEISNSKNVVKDNHSSNSGFLSENPWKGCNQTDKSTEIDKDSKPSSTSVKAASVTIESLDDTCSRDSAKGFFARKQEEKRLQNSRPCLLGNVEKPKEKNCNSSKDSDRHSCPGSDHEEEFVVEANKEHDTKLTFTRAMNESDCDVLINRRKISTKNIKTDILASGKPVKSDLDESNKIESNTSTGKSDLSVMDRYIDVSTVKRDSSEKSISKTNVCEIKSDGNIPWKKSLKKPDYKSPLQRELEAIIDTRIENITVETDSSDDEKINHKGIERNFVQPVCKRNTKVTRIVDKNSKISKPDQKHCSFTNAKGNTHQQLASSKEKSANNYTSENRETAICRVESHKDKSIISSESSLQKSEECTGARLHTDNFICLVDPTAHKSKVCVGSTQTFQITDVRIAEEDSNLPGGFVSPETNDFFDNNGDDDAEGFVGGNVSEGEEDFVDHDLCKDADKPQNGSLSSDKSCTTSFGNQDERINELCSSNQLSDTNEILSSNCESLLTDSTDLLNVVAEKVKIIQKNALEILMETSKALQKKSKLSEMTGKVARDVSNSTGSRNVNEFLMSNRGKTLKTSTSARGKVQSVPVKNVGENLNECIATNQRKCPFYKKIPGTSLTVDAFKYGSIPDCKAYILSHFHYDHYGGLNKAFCHPLYCSQITGNLVMKKIGVKAQYVHTVPLNTPTVVEDVEITFLEANHCPGAVLILFKLKNGKVFLHTGDFRACEEMEVYPELQNLRIHSLYLDTTYCDPQYDFPSQKKVVKYAIKVAVDAVKNNPSTLIVCGSYTIGKERIFRGIAEELDCKICVTRDKKSVIDCLEDGWLKARTSLVWSESQLHVLPMAKLNLMGLKEHLQKNGKKYSAVLGIKPTGWTYNKKLISLDHIKPEVNKENVKVYGLPYSEHSSFLELKRFVQFTKPEKILPTVNNGNYHSRKKMEAIFEAWMEEVRFGRPSTSQKQPSVSLWTV